MAEKEFAKTGHTLSDFTFRASSPLFHFEKAALCWKPLQASGASFTEYEAIAGTHSWSELGAEAVQARMWVRGPDGRQCMEATVGGRRPRM